jgi:hypothetical protein
MKGRLKLKTTMEVEAAAIHIDKKQVNRYEDFKHMRRYLSPLPEDLPLLKDHYPGEWFQRIDGKSIVQRWKDSEGKEYNLFQFYPAEGMIRILDDMEKDWTIRDDYFLLLWKRLQKFGIAKYGDVPCSVTVEDFDKYLNNKLPIKKFSLKINPPSKRLKLKVKE